MYILIYCLILLQCFQIFILKVWEQLFLHKTANDCFFLCQGTCVSAKITAVICFEN